MIFLVGAAMELLISLLIFVVIVVAALYLVRLIPDATIQTVARVIIVVAALIWLVTHIRPIIHAIAGT